jgi:putative toxin-antitoxin system antitoxin component (TIGR02293 family)
MSDIVALVRKSHQQQIKAIHQGLPAATFRAMADYLGVTQGQLATSLRIQPRTLRKRTALGRLNPEESEKSLRAARVFAKSCDILGDKQKAKEWMVSRIKSLGGQKPLDMLETDIGTQEVLNVLNAIEWGVYL